MSGFKRILQQHSGTIILTISLILVILVLYLLRNIILPFLIGLVIAYILLPAVSWMERKLPPRGKWRGAKRIFTILLVFVLIIAIFGIAGYFVVTALINGFANIVKDVPGYISTAIETVQNWLASLRSWLPAGADQQVTGVLGSLGSSLASAFQNIFSNIATFVPSTISYAMGFATLPIFLFYILKDHEHLVSSFYSWLPENASNRARDIAAVINQVLGGYIRAQLVMGLFVGTLVLIGLLIIGAPLAVGLAAVAGVTELVPILGPWIGGGIAVLVVLAIEPSKVLWVIIVFLAVQLVENSFLVPRIHGQFLQIHPAIAVVLIIIGASLAGFWGLILAVPLASTVVKLYSYVATSARKEEIPQSGPGNV